ncbi:type IV pilus inner membrane component PilO [Alysiella filiformis]|uniref:Type IV pilus assembly protein PilO n=1 Tax=Alysiella filiformis DSM 16848 TaxID=1120981 RepID=A0A286EHD6_9NEIS|nr:type 4a pilus biogenesis protein PilO [Alysiella filiformis]QMT32331.1 type 4a pilus biogenesis protein PilO [Alysiella filiformis]UBQ56749.1 type 4a pilus biogenesis protein PilO [Alysiella filiformis DSM 16848]SOD70323.1 type IV pilus assembly protein PilO [Alysiella filiformis DSM 16848]
MKKKNELDIQKLHLAPKAVQFLVAIILAVLIVVAGYFAQFQTQLEDIKAAEEKEDELKTQYEQKAIQAASLESLQLELKMIEESIEYLIKQLPTSAEIPGLIQELHNAAANNGLSLSSVLPQQSQVDGNIERLPHQISVTGSYEQLSSFMRDVGKMSRIVTLSGVTITPHSKNKNKLTLTALANTYKAVDVPKPASDAASGAQPAN